MKEMIQKARNFLTTRQQAYNQVFNKESIHAVKVLEDLAHFCRANQTTFHTDPRIHALIEGRKEVWHRIQQHLKLDSDQLWKLYSNGKDPSS